MSDWQAGDRAFCVHDGEWFAQNCPGQYTGPRAGSVRDVEDVRMWRGEVYLTFADWPKRCYGAEYFRKLRDHTPDAEDEETIRLLNRAPVREPVS